MSVVPQCSCSCLADLNMTDSNINSRLAHPAWALAFAGVPFFMVLYAGPLFIDDAYITFRYAENLARGHGFVFNTEPLLGTTAPFYCFLLAGARLVGLPMIHAAFAIGLVSGALAPVFCWRIGVSNNRAAAGFLAALLLCLSPHWWRNASTGMETTLAGTLALAAIYLDLRGRAVASGVLCALLVLTRPDGATLPLLIFIIRVVTDRHSAIRFAVGGVVVLILWLIYAFLVFGSPLPQSLDAKKLIHAYPWYKALSRYLLWFATLKEPAGAWRVPDSVVFIIRAGMIGVSALWMAGADGIFRSWREGLVLVLWPVVFILGLCAVEVDTFFWYKMPIVPVFFFVSAFGFDLVYKWVGEWRPLNTGVTTAALRGALFVVIALFIVLQLVNAVPVIFDKDKLKTLTDKEKIFEEMSQLMRDKTERSGKVPGEVKVYVGEVGVIGYEMMDYEVIDSAGINSREVYEIRKLDWERMKKAHPEYNWQHQKWGSIEWSKEAIGKYRPDFIASDIRYLHLKNLARDEEFKQDYSVIKSWSDHNGNRYVVLERLVKKDGS